MSTRVYNLNKGEVPATNRIVPAVVKKAMPDMVKMLSEKAEQLAPSSGRQHRNKLKDSITGKVSKGGLEGRVVATAPHAHLVHDGTSPHAVMLDPGSKKKALVIPTGGEFAFRRSANHPGARAQPFLDEALAVSSGKIYEILKDVGNAAFKEALLK